MLGAKSASASTVISIWGLYLKMNQILVVSVQMLQYHFNP